MPLPAARIVRDATSRGRQTTPERPRRARAASWQYPWVDSGAFARAVLAKLPDGARDAVAAGALPAALAIGFAAAHSRWPTAPLPGDAFTDHLVRRLEARTDLPAALPRLRVDDLYLAWWSGADDADAGVRAFEGAYAADVARLVARFHRIPAATLQQRLRVQLFGAPRRIAEYTGFGYLRSWLRVMATRLFVDLGARGP